jgi:Methane oxygenase PmoA
MKGALACAVAGLLSGSAGLLSTAPGPDSRRVPQGGAYSLAPVTYGHQLKTPDGRVVLEYMTRKPDDSGLTSPSVACFHPLNTPSGERITAFAPDDHRHHRGMYIAWHDAEFRQPIDTTKRTPTSPLFGWNITKVDFWGWGQYAPRDGRVIQTADVRLTGADARHAQMEIRNDWMVGKRKMLDETTGAAIAERDGVYVIDLTIRLAPLVDYQLNKQSFSGFNLQARKDGDSYYTNAAGPVMYPDPHYSVPELNWPAAAWYGYVIKLAGGKTLGAAVLDHPTNPPSTWHNSRTLWMLNPNIAALGPLTIRADAPLTLRYRVVVHDGPTPTDVVQKLSDEWRAMK